MRRSGWPRRTFLGTLAAGSVAAPLGELAFLRHLPRVSAAETNVEKLVQLDGEIEPLVRLLEETPREKLLETVGQRIRAGTSYREVLAALLLAGVRNVQPRPAVGFKFHAVLVVNSAHLASLASPDEHRWLPIFWALDYFKDAQAQQQRQSPWQMAPVDPRTLPKTDQARQAFLDAMSAWDEERADGAIAMLARTAGAAEIYELLYRYAARDFRSIGHKAIFVANSWRTLQCIGWQFAEPVLRSLVSALLQHDGKNPAQSDLEPDRPWRENQQLLETLRQDGSQGKLDAAATSELLATLREQPADAAPRLVVDLLNRGVAVQSIWDALFVGSGELLMRQPAIVALHAVTSTNAIRFAWQTAADETTRRLLLLQNASFLPLFREAMKGRGKVADMQLDRLEAAPAGDTPPTLEQIFADVSGNRENAARRTLRYVEQGGDLGAFAATARLLVFLKGTGSHDYKFSSAVLEDYHHVSSGWRGRFLAAGTYNLSGSGQRDSGLVARTRAALA